ncbi:MAG: c-type cytochrome [Thiotrichales bacterium]|mgnify:FL=1|jgi:cytochrome c|nr:c-type cytochrome [Thiotrichales bacterium]MBT3613049.1 c-type cytochrome [Thiotrichales bacterium]MBT3751951.1 c-type cytochrome [Thiotrichales bacterium]MBT3837655.1 c-type cytochrome [Thiotrichales bacterium]MBT4152307.1 c-type cytochrome [Thiotrichales bacterium]
MNITKQVVLASAVTLLSSIATTAMADGEALYKAKTCWSCHGKDAKTPIIPIYPILAGQNKDYALNQMKDIKSGARNNGQTAAMQGVMGLVNDAEMAEIAEWLSTLK